MSFQNIEEVGERHLHLFWTTGEIDTAENMILMYTRNALLNHWWDKVTVVLWGSAQKLYLESESVRAKVALARQAGVEFSACLSCAVNLGITSDLEAEGIEVIRWGKKLTQLMQGGKHVLTF